MSGRTAIATGAALGALGVALGAFGAHGLAARLTPADLAIYETGVRYHFYHAFALVLVGLFALQGGGIGGARRSGTSSAAWAFIAGIALFSGSLYVLTLTGMRWLGAVTPIGGLAFIAGWVLFARAALART
jgi:uncharacterized membrane protein YgdD (TMEM256/DUF423 family)